jgi:hypothetical protein
MGDDGCVVHLVFFKVLCLIVFFWIQGFFVIVVEDFMSWVYVKLHFVSYFDLQNDQTVQNPLTNK